MIEFKVEGIPVPQGSPKIAKSKAGKAFLIMDSKKLRVWREVVRVAAEKAVFGKRITKVKPLKPGGVDRWVVYDEPVGVHVEFFFTPPKKPRWPDPAVKPDLDKLVRAVFDSLTDAHVLQDDSRVVSLHAEKSFRSEPGVRVQVQGFEY